MIQLNHPFNMLRKTLLIVLFCSFGAFAQDIRSNTEALSVGVQGNFVRWSSQFFSRLDAEDPNGLGGGVRVGYGFNQRFEAFASYDLQTFSVSNNEWDTFRMSSLAAGMRVNFGGTLQALRPFAELGVASTGFKIDPVLLNNQLVTYQLRGGANLWLGCGTNFFLTPNIALNATVNATTGKFSNFLVAGTGTAEQPDLRTFRFSVGVSYFLNRF
jgi:Outer membrane protein beta-barrel domain